MNGLLLLVVGLVLLLGFLGEKAAVFLRLPAISAYVLIGILLGPSALGVLNKEFLTLTEPIIDIALAIIGLLIGGSLSMRRVRALGPSIMTILFAQFLGALVFTALGIWLILPLLLPAFASDPRLPAFAAIFGLIAAATAPAATLAVIHEIRATGPFTTTILAVVAADDGLSLLAYSLLIPFVLPYLGGGHASWTIALGSAGLHIALSIAAGIGAALIFRFLRNRLKTRAPLMPPLLALTLMLYGTAHYFEFNGLLAAMVMGFTLANFGGHFDELSREITLHYEEILFILFFILSGAHAELTGPASIWIIALLYIALRILGKVAGAAAGAMAAGRSWSTGKYTGLALLPQAGVALGLGMLVKKQLGDNPAGALILNVVIAGVAFNELAGPVLARYALTRAGESRRQA